MDVLGYIGFRNWLVAVALLLCSAVCACAQDIKAPEHQVKAAYLFNFAKLTEWPTNAFQTAESPLVIGIFGNDPVTEYLDAAIGNRKAHGRNIRVARFTRSIEATNCHILYIAMSERDRFPALLGAVRGKPVLTISEIDRFAAAGGIIGLIKDKKGIMHFEVHRGLALQAQLKLSSKLLVLARSPSEEDTK